MSALAVISGICALLLYIPLCLQLYRSILRQNIATWILWVILDVIATLSIWWQGGNYFLVAMYVIGGSVTVCFIFKSRLFSWTWLESLVTTLVIASIVLWLLSGARLAIVMSTLGVVIAGIPQLVDSWRNPWGNSVAIYLGFTVVNFLAVIAGKDWTIEERFYPTSCSLLCFCITFATARKYLKNQTKLC